MTTKKCPFCAEDIQKQAKVCRFCGKSFGGSLEGFNRTTEELILLIMRIFLLILLILFCIFTYYTYKYNINWVSIGFEKLMIWSKEYNIFKEMFNSVQK